MTAWRSKALARSFSTSSCEQQANARLGRLLFASEPNLGICQLLLKFIHSTLLQLLLLTARLEQAVLYINLTHHTSTFL